MHDTDATIYVCVAYRFCVKHLQSNTDSNISGTLTVDARTLIYQMANATSQDDFNKMLRTTDRAVCGSL
jgi:hypothetical protein